MHLEQCETGRNETVINVIRVEKGSTAHQTARRSRRLAELTGRKVRPSVRSLAVAALLALSPAGGSLAAGLVPTGSSPAQGHAEVIAQGIASLEKGKLVWQVTSGEAPTKAKKSTHAGPGFLLTDSGQMILVESNGNDAKKLAEGEATFIPKGKKQTRQSSRDQPADYFDIQIVKSSNGSNDDGAFQSDSFGSLTGARDIDLVRDVLNHNDETTIPKSDAPVLVFVTDGEIKIVESGHKDAQTLTKGQAATFDSEIKVSSADQGGTFVAAVVGEEVELPHVQSSQAPTPQPTSTPAIDEPLAPTAEPTEDVSFDGDADGLEDTYEPAFGTDPTKKDSDGMY